MVSTGQTFGCGEQAIAADRFYAALATDAAELGVSKLFRAIRPRFDLHLFDRVDSTSTQLWRMLASGYGAGTVAIARQQSAGRGQRGRIWQSELGGLYLSLAIEPDWPVANAAQLTCLSAWGIATALNNLGVPISVKWPNDLFFEGKKLGGILTETKLATKSATKSATKVAHSAVVTESLTAFSAESLTESLIEPKPLPYIKQAVIGVGINWHNSTPETGTSLVKILESLPESCAKTKIDCLEMLAALVLRGILQGVFFQKRVGSQVFMKDYENLLTQFKKTVSLDRKLLDQLIFSEGLSNCETNSSQASLSKEHLLSQLLNRSGEVVGVSEEGYLKVALIGTPIEWSANDRLRTNSAESLLLFSPSAAGL